MISWVPFNPDDKGMWPNYGEAVFVMCLQKGKVRFFNEAFLGIDDKWYVQIRDKAGRTKDIVELGEFDENSLAWTTVNLPDWWKMKEKK